MLIIGDIKKMTESKHYDPYHLACVLLLDKSGSMSGKPINALNEALIDFKGRFESDNEDFSVLDICIIAFGGSGPKGDIPDIEILQPFAPANEMYYDTENYPIYAYGEAPLAQAVETGLGMITQIETGYHQNEIEYYIPCLVCITGGKSTEDYEYYNYVKQSLKKSVGKKHVMAYGIGIGADCNYKKLYEFFGEGCTFRFEDLPDKGSLEIFFSKVVSSDIRCMIDIMSDIHAHEDPFDWYR